MISLSTIKGNKSAVVFVRDKVAIASFPARLNNLRIPTLEEVEKLCPAELNQDAIDHKAQFANESSLPTIDSGKVDSKGRAIGFTVYVWQWVKTGEWYASVQNARFINGKWEDFGVKQRGKKYISEDAAKSTATMIAKSRVNNLK